MPVPPPTDRLVFREMRPDDAPSVHAMLSDPEARRFYPRMADPAESVRWVERQIERYARDGHGLWALLALGDGRFLGDCGLTWQPTDGPPILEVGWHLLAAERGRGFATEAARECLRHAFAHDLAAEVGSIVHPDNVPSMRVAERVHRSRRVMVRDGETLWLYTTRKP